jgi:hypothetical protein
MGKRLRMRHVFVLNKEFDVVQSGSLSIIARADVHSVYACNADKGYF